MTLEEMHATWQASNKKLVAYKILNESLIKQIISQRSDSILSIIKGKYKRLGGFLFFYLVVFSAAIIGDPFDYKLLRPYIPLSLLVVIIFIFLLLTVQSYRRITRFELNNNNLVQTLEQVIAQHQKLRKRLVFTFLVTGGLFDAAFTDRIIHHRGLKDALLFIMLLIGIGIFTFWLIYKLEIFQNRNDKILKNNLEELKARLQELQELREN
jgi:uncharacterized membrane-anchored protein YhcB (DUF1043 family)